MVQQPSDKLDHDLIQLLEGLNERKIRIDQQAQFLSNLPKISPFNPLPPACSDVSSNTWDKWWAEHDRIEREADIFREDEFALMKKVAMSKTTNMSREDTDLVGLTLGTLEAFSKLEHLIRSRRKQLQILDLRIKWDHQSKKLRTLLSEIQIEQPKLLKKIRWSPPLAYPDSSSPSDPSSPLLRQGLVSSPILSSDSTSPSPNSPSKSQSQGNRQDPSRKRQPTSSRLSISSIPDFTCIPSIDHSNTPAKPSPSTPEFRTPSPTSTLCTTTTANTNTNSTTTRLVDSLHTHPTNSQPSTPPSQPSTTRAPSISAQSRAMRIQSLALQLSSLTTKFHTLNRSLLPTSATIDRLIDSGLHLPEAFLDEQDALEAPVRALQSVESLRFFATLLDQYKEADEIWFAQRSLETETAELRRELEAQLTATCPTRQKLGQLRSKLENLVECHKKNLKRSKEFNKLPTHPSLFSEQVECNAAVVEALASGSDRVQARLDQLFEALGRYAVAVEAMDCAKAIKFSMETCKTNLSSLVDDLENLERAHPNRAELLRDQSSLEEGDEDESFQKIRTAIEQRLGEQLAIGIGLLDRIKDVLVQLENPGVDPNMRSDTQKIEQSLRERADVIVNLLAERSILRDRFEKVRDGWRKLISLRVDLERLRDRILGELNCSKWKAKHKAEESVDYAPVPGSELEPVDRLQVILGSEVEKGLKTSTDARKSLESLKPFVDSILELLRGSEHSALYATVSYLYACLTDAKVPELVKLERLRDGIKRQTRELVELETHNEALTLEGGRLMKRVQDQIGVELDKTYQEESGGDKLVEVNPNLVRARKKLMGRVSEYVGEVDQFVSSMASRVSFVTDAGFNGSEEGAMSDGRTTVLVPTVHDAEVRSTLNGMSMNLLGLRDHLANESALLGWIDGEQARYFGRVVGDARREVGIVIEGLDSIEVELKRWTQLIDSDRLQPPRSDEEINERVGEPVASLQKHMDLIATQISQSTSKKLEDFIGACPTTSGSNLFKSDQFILPKQMAHHQLQSLYNATARKMKGLVELRENFVGGSNERRREEFKLRGEWRSVLGELAKKCEGIEDQAKSVGQDLERVVAEIKAWEAERFESCLESDLVQALELTFPGYLVELEPFKFKISSVDENIARLQAEIDEVNSKRAMIGQEIQERMIEDQHMLNELTNAINQLWPQWASLQDDGQRLRELMGRLDADVEKRRMEHGLRASWSERCAKILQDAAADQLIDRFEGQLSAHLTQWAQDQSSLACAESFQASVETLRCLSGHQAENLVIVSRVLESVRSKALIISEEVERLSQVDLPHPYLSKTDSEVTRLSLRLGGYVEKIEDDKREVIGKIVELDGEMLKVSFTEVEEGVLKDQTEVESSRVSNWIETRVERFLDEVVQETEEVDRLQSLADKIEDGSIGRSTLSPSHPLNSSTSSSTSSSSLLNEEDRKIKERFVEIKNLVELTSKAHARLSQFDCDRARLLAELALFERTLIESCLSELRVGLNRRDFVGAYQASGSNPLTKLREQLDRMTSRVNRMLEGAENGLKACRQQKARSNAMLQILERLAALDLDRWVDPRTNAKHAPLPTKSTRREMGDALEALRSPIVEMSEADGLVDRVLLDRIIGLYDSQKLKLSRLGDLSDFHEAVQTCDEAFSNLLDALDMFESTQREEEDAFSGRVDDGSKSLQCVSAKACAVATDARVEYHLERLTQTWAELSDMVKDRHASTTEPSHSGMAGRFQAPRSSTGALSKIPVLNRSPGEARLRTCSVGSADHLTPTRPRPSTMIPTIATPDPNMQEHVGARKRVESGQRHQLSVSVQHSRHTPDLKMASKRHLTTEPHPPLPTRSRPPSSMKGGSMGRLGVLRNRVSINSMNTPSRTAFGTSTPPSTRMDLTEKKVRYQPQSNRNIEKMVGKVINRLAVEVHVAPAEGAWEDNSGLYWIGEKIYFCRILRSQTVMVRIGGGWNELSSFLLEHSKQAVVNVGVSPQQPSNLEAGGPERWINSSEVRRVSADHQMLLGVAGPSGAISTPRSRTLSTQPMATPPEAIQLYLRKAQIGSQFGTPTPPVSSLGPARRHWRP